MQMTLRELRKARKLTQVRMAKKLGITQDGVSRLEKRSDLRLSTLRKTVQAMGGNLSLVAEFPDRAPVVLSCLAEDEPARKPSRAQTIPPQTIPPQTDPPQTVRRLTGKTLAVAVSRPRPTTVVWGRAVSCQAVLSR